MHQSQLARPPSFRGSLKGLEADINHANALAEAIQRSYGGACIQMRLSCSPLAPIFLFLLQCFDCTCSYSLSGYLGLFQVLVYKVYVDGLNTISTFERRASVREFYTVIYPSLLQLESNLLEREQSKKKGRGKEIVGRKRMDDWKKLSDKDSDRDDECGICLEVCSKMVLPSCNHAMCIKCYRDWNVRSESCPFCRGSLKRVRSTDLWVLTNKSDVVDTMTLEIDNISEKPTNPCGLGLVRKVHPTSCLTYSNRSTEFHCNSSENNCTKIFTFESDVHVSYYQGLQELCEYKERKK